MRIVNTMYLSKEKTVCHYVDLIVKVFGSNSKNTQGWGNVECQLRTSRSGMCLDQNWMFVDRGEEGGGGPKLRLFLRTSKMNDPFPNSLLLLNMFLFFCFSLSFYSLFLHSFCHCFAC